MAVLTFLSSVVWGNYANAGEPPDALFANAELTVS